MNHRAPEVEIGEQHRTFQLRLRDGQVHGGERLSFGGRRAGNDQGMEILLALNVVQPGAQTPELLGGHVMRAFGIDQVRFRRRPEGNGLAERQKIAPVWFHLPGLLSGQPIRRRVVAGSGVVGQRRFRHLRFGGKVRWR